MGKQSTVKLYPLPKGTSQPDLDIQIQNGNNADVAPALDKESAEQVGLKVFGNWHNMPPYIYQANKKSRTINQGQIC